MWPAPCAVICSVKSSCAWGPLAAAFPSVHWRVSAVPAQRSVLGHVLAAQAAHQELPAGRGSPQGAGSQPWEGPSGLRPRASGPGAPGNREAPPQRRTGEREEWGRGSRPERALPTASGTGPRKALLRGGGSFRFGTRDTWVTRDGGHIVMLQAGPAEVVGGCRRIGLFSAHVEMTVVTSGHPGEQGSDHRGWRAPGSGGTRGRRAGFAPAPLLAGCFAHVCSDPFPSPSLLPFNLGHLAMSGGSLDCHPGERGWGCHWHVVGGFWVAAKHPTIYKRGSSPSPPHNRVPQTQNVHCAETEISGYPSQPVPTCGLTG